MTRAPGFTLVELMVTLAIVAILASVAAPGLSNFLENGRSFRAANTVAAAARFARAEAVNMQSPVVICGRDSSSEDCSDSSDWRSGLIVFVDTNRNGDRDANERILKTSAAFDARDSVQSSLTRLVYTPEGRTQNMLTLTVRYCPNSATSAYNRAVSVSASGRVSSVKGAAAGTCSSAG